MPGTEEKTEQPGLFASLRRLLRLGVQSVHVRIGIFSIELREEGQRLLRAFALAAAFVLLAVVTLVLVSFTIVFSVWDDPHARLAALWILCALYAAGTIVAGALLSRAARPDKLPFSETLRELEKDREWVQKPKSPQE